MTLVSNPGIVAALGGYEPSAEQAVAIEYPPQPLGIIAGAGSGKTAVIAARIANFILTGVAQPNQILGLTFTNKAAAELEERVRTATAPLGLDPGDEPSIFTYNAFADRVIRDYGPKIGIEPEVALLSDAQSYMLFGSLLEEVVFDKIAVRGLSYLIGRMRQLADQCSNHLLEPERLVEADNELIDTVFGGDGSKLQRDLAKTIAERPDYVRAVRAYIDRKRELKRIDYGDQIAFAYRVVTRAPEVARTLRERWPLCLLDEYQDTNVAQRKMMQAIYPQGCAVTVVGDPDQAIYAWRGATLHNILSFPEHFRDADGGPAAKVPLEVSFRSGKRILEAADAIIAGVSEERRGVVGKVLAHHPPTGSGEVTCDLVESDEDEAVMIAAEIKALAGDAGSGLGEGAGTLPFDEVAILCRKRRLFGKILMALRAEGIPVEVVGLGGLLQVPEVVDLLSYLRLVAHPEENISFARIAMGPRWRIHYADMAALARWAARNTAELRAALGENRAERVEVDPGTERFSLSEAAGRAAEVDELSDEARSRLVTLDHDMEAMRTAIKGRSLAEAVEKVLEMSGIEDELLSAATPVASAALGNLSSVLDRAAAFSPLEGSATLDAFLDFLEAAQDVEDIEIAQPQMENAVKLMTVHQAKGLEFDLVYIPGMAQEIFPDVKVDGDPTSHAATVPFWARDDQAFLPRFGGVRAAFSRELKERAEEEERRLAYVAMTRARKALHLSAAHWYGVGNYERKNANGPGMFLLELAGAPATDDTPARPPHPAVTVRSNAVCPPENPLRAQWEKRARAWPPTDEPVPDPLFPGGWRRAAVEALSDPGRAERAVAAGMPAPLAPEDDLAAAAGVRMAELDRAKAEVAQQLELVAAPPRPSKPDEELKSLSVSSIVQLAHCPKQFYWTVVRPLPRRPNEAARLGSEIHRWIELRSMGQRRLDDPEYPPDMSPEELFGPLGAGATETGAATAGHPQHPGQGDAAPGSRSPGGAPVRETASGTLHAPTGVASPSVEDTLKAAFDRSVYASLRPYAVEQPFTIALEGGFLVRGRIDAVYRHEDGTWELVDYKTGMVPEESDETVSMQLAIYALAARQIWDIELDRLEVTYFYLKSGTLVTTPAADLRLGEAELITRFRRVETGMFEPIPGALCRWCDFLRFCSAGRAYSAGGPKDPSPPMP